MSSRRTPRAAAALPASWRRLRSPSRIHYRCLLTVAQRFTCISPVPRGLCVTLNIFTITCASSRCSSTAFALRRTMAACTRTLHGRGSALNLRDRMRSNSRRTEVFMIYDLVQPHYNHAPQFPGQPPNSIGYQQLAVIDGATVERCNFMSHSASHVDAPFHFLPHLPAIHELPLSHFYGACVALDLRGLAPSHPIDADDLRRHEELISKGTFVLLKTGWGEKRGNSKEFLTAWPYMSGSGAQYLLDRNAKGMGIDGLSTGGYPEKHA